MQIHEAEVNKYHLNQDQFLGSTKKQKKKDKGYDTYVKEENRKHTLNETFLAITSQVKQ